jgi:hypothetical protein
VTPENPIVGGTVLRIPAIQSPNFVTGVSGWFIGQDGSVEFDNAVFRGTVTATQFGAVVAVSAGPYAGTYLIEMAEYTDGSGNHLAVIEWLNQTNPAAVPPYLAGVTGPGAGNIASLHSGQQSNADSDTAIWLLSAIANDGSNSRFLVDAAQLQLFSGAGPVLVPSGAGFAVDSWHAITLDAGWTAGAQAPQYRLLPDGNVQVRGQASHASFSAGTNINGSSPLAAAYQPAQTRFYRASDPTDNAAPVQVSAAGVFAARANATFTATQVLMDGTYSVA